MKFLAASLGSRALIWRPRKKPSAMSIGLQFSEIYYNAFLRSKGSDVAEIESSTFLIFPSSLRTRQIETLFSIKSDRIVAPRAQALSQTRTRSVPDFGATIPRGRRVLGSGMQRREGKMLELADLAPVAQRVICTHEHRLHTAEIATKAQASSRASRAKVPP